MPYRVSGWGTEGLPQFVHLALALQMLGGRLGFRFKVRRAGVEVSVLSHVMLDLEKVTFLSKSQVSHFENVSNAT